MLRLVSIVFSYTRPTVRGSCKYLRRWPLKNLIVNKSYCQASCGRMSREKIEDLVCAPHLSYTQQVWSNISPNTSLIHNRYEEMPFMIPLFNIHNRYWQNTSEKLPCFTQKIHDKIKVSIFSCAIISDWGFLSASLDQQKC